MLATVLGFAFCCLIWALLLRSCNTSLRGAVIRPEFVGIALLLFTYVGFPLSWSAGFGKPWTGLEVTNGLRVGSLLLVGASAAGIWMASYGQNSLAARAEEAMYAFPLIRHARVTVAAVAATASALVLLAIVRPFFFTGIGTLVRRQGDAQGSGIGPILAVVTVSLWAALYTDLRTRPRLLAAMAAASIYLVSIFITGQKSRFVIFALLVFVRGSRSVTRIGGPRIVAAVIAGVVVVGVTVTYQVQVRGGGFAAPIDGVDRSTTAGEIQYTFNRFAQSTLDSTRTLGPTLTSDLNVIRFSPEPVWGAVVSPIPSTLLPGKPVPPSRQFSQLYFRERWIAGTGIPPSFGAEMVWYFGQAGAILVHLLLFFWLTRFSLRVPSRLSVVRHGSRLLLVPTVVMLLKGGTDGAVRFAFTLYIGLGVLWAISSVLGVSLGVDSSSDVKQGPSPRANAML